MRESKEVLKFTIWEEGGRGETTQGQSTYRVYDDGSNFHLELRKHIGEGEFKWERLDELGWSFIGFLLSSHKFQNLFVSKMKK